MLKNSAKTPYPAGAAPKGNTVGRIMQFRVSGVAGTGCQLQPGRWARHAAHGPMVRLRRALRAAAQTRQLTLNEVMGMPVTATTR